MIPFLSLSYSYLTLRTARGGTGARCAAGGNVSISAAAEVSNANAPSRAWRRLVGCPAACPGFCPTYLLPSGPISGLIEI